MSTITRDKSTLSTYEKLSPNITSPRANVIRRITPHCVAGNLTIEATLGLAGFQAGGSASTNYAIGTDGRIGLGVLEKNRAWCSSSRTNDNQSITFEIANNGGAPEWRMSDAAINSWVELVIDICNFYGYKKVAYKAKPSSVALGESATETWIKTWDPGPDTMLITLHCWYAAKACPGPYLINKLPSLVEEINKRLLNNVTEVPTSPPIVQPPTNEITQPYTIRITANSLNVRSGPGTNNNVVRTLVNDKNIYTIIEESAGTGATKWGKLKSGLGWISLDYTKKA